MHFGDFADVALSAILKSSQVQTIVDYAKLSPSSDQPIVLALKKFIPCYAAELCIKTPSAFLRAWIEREIHLDITNAPFDPQDQALLPAAGSCAACPKRTGNNPLLFLEIRQKSI